jgi:hypothetical protein
LGPLQVRIGMHTGAPLADPQDANDYMFWLQQAAADPCCCCLSVSCLLSRGPHDLGQDEG